jgi:hypothetical protein
MATILSLMATEETAQGMFHKMAHYSFLLREKHLMLLHKARYKRTKTVLN